MVGTVYTILLVYINNKSGSENMTNHKNFGLIKAIGILQKSGNEYEFEMIGFEKIDILDDMVQTYCQSKNMGKDELIKLLKVEKRNARKTV